MQTQGGDAAEAAITSSERIFLHEVLVDWNQNGLFDHELSDISEYADEIAVDRQLAGTAPAEILLIEGSAAAELSLTIGGEYNLMPLTGVFSPYNTASPFFGEEMVGPEITYRIGVETPLGVLWYPQFVGNVTTVTPRRADNTVEITALDRVEKLRRPILLPPWAVSDIHVNFGELDSQLCRSHWVIDHALRLCDVSPGPKRPTLPEEFLQTVDSAIEGEGLQFYLTGNGGYLPTVGWLDNPSAMTFPADGTPMYDQIGPLHPDAPEGTPRPLALAALGTPIRESGPYVSPANYQGILRYWCETRDILHEDAGDEPWNNRPNSSHYIGFTINTNGPNGQMYRTVDLHQALEVRLGHFFSIYLEIEKGKIRTRFQQDAFEDELDQIVRTGAWIDLPTGVDQIDVFCVWDLANSSGVTWRMSVNEYDSGEVSAGAYVNGNQAFYDQIGGRVTVGQAVSLSDVYYAARDRFDPLFNPERCFRLAKYRAQLDVGKNRLTSMPYFEPKEAWEVITEVAAAEMGAVFWDEEGVFRFWNLDTIQEKQGQVVRRLSLDEASDLIITSSLDSVRNVYTVDANRKRAVIGRTVFEADDVQQFFVPALSARYFRVWGEDIQSPIPFKLNRYVSEEGNPFAPYWDDSVQGGYCAQWFEDDQWAERPEFVDGLDIYPYFTKDGALVVRIWNGYDLDARLAKGLTNESEDNSSPAFRIQGTQIIDDPNATIWSRDYESMEKYGPRNLELSGDWYQDTVEGSTLIGQLVQRTSVPTPTTDSIEIAGDPRLQLGDTLALYDPSGLGADVRIQILGINRTYSKGEGLTDTLSVEMINPSGRPPVVNAGDDLTLAVGERRRLVGTYMNYGAPNTVTWWEIVSGPDRVGETVNGTDYEFIPSAEGSYVLQFSLTSDYGDASDTVTITARPQGSGGGTLPTDPGEALWIGRPGGNWYNIGLGKPDDHYDYDWDEILNGFSDPDRFYLNEDGNVEFKVKITEKRTSNNTKYPRSELRELNIEGADGGEVSWNGSSGTHYMKGRSRVRRVTQVKPTVCFFQIHDASSDLIRVQTVKKGSGLAIQCKYTKPGQSEVTVELMSSYQIDQWVDWYIEIVNGRCRILLDGQEVLNITGMGTSGCYFKHGAYAQSAVNEVTDTESGNGNQWFIVETEKGSFETWHTGYPAPTTPDFSGGGNTTPYRRLYLVNETPDFIPNGTIANVWDAAVPNALTAPRRLAGLPTSAATNVTATEAVVTSPLDGLLRQYVSGPADADGVLKGSVQVCAGASQSDADADMRMRVVFWVTVGDTNQYRGQGFQFVSENEVATVPSGMGITVNLDDFEIPFFEGDRLVVEMGFRASNTVTEQFGYTLYYGGTGARDMWINDTDMDLPVWFDYQTEGGSFGGTAGEIEDPGHEPDPVDGIQAAVVHGWGTKLASSDEFSYTGAPDPTKWNLYDGTGHNGNGTRDPERFTVDGEKLILQGLANGSTGGAEHLYDSTGGGRWEARVRSYATEDSNGNDYHPLLLIWPESNSRSEDGEYDFMENSVPGDIRASAYMHYPDDPEDSETEQEHFTKDGVLLSEWHNFAFEYKRGTGGYVRGYLDGEMWFEHTGGGGPNGRRDIQDMPAGHLTIQLDNFDGTDQTPATMEVAWVRVYDAP